MHYHHVAGNMHIHTVYSDGSGLHADVARAAARAGLDFVITTDHNIWVEGAEGYYDNVLLLVGEEIHHVRRDPQANHLLVYGAESELSAWAAQPQALIDEANRRGALCFLAHPFERPSPISQDLAAIPWEDWDVNGYVGIELWNTMSEFKGLLWNRLVAVLYSYFPSLGFVGPYRATRRQWDRLLAEGKRVAVIGGADAHATLYRMGPLERVVFGYEELFRWINTHILLAQPLRGDLKQDKQSLYEGLRAGRTWVAYDRIAPSQGFRFQARSVANVATVGEALSRAGAVTIEVETPRRGAIRLLRNGRIIARAIGKRLTLTTAEAGVYRVEVWRPFRGRWRGWIFSSPIYVR